MGPETFSSDFNVSQKGCTISKRGTRFASSQLGGNNCPQYLFLEKQELFSTIEKLVELSQISSKFQCKTIVTYQLRSANLLAHQMVFPNKMLLPET